MTVPSGWTTNPGNWCNFVTLAAAPAGNVSVSGAVGVTVHFDPNLSSTSVGQYESMLLVLGQTANTYTLEGGIGG